MRQSALIPMVAHEKVVGGLNLNRMEGSTPFSPADLGALANGADAERLVVAQAGLQHIDIALLEDAQRQPAAGKKYRVQRKERELVYGCASSASARWRTSTRQSPRKALASSSAK